VGKFPIVGIRDRNSKIVGRVVENTRAATLHGLINQSVKRGSHIYSDGHKGYHGLTGYKQSEVCHSIGEYVRNKIHVNGVESFWALFKRAYHGTFHSISKKHLQRYVDEFTYRQNMRKCDVSDIIATTTKGAFGKYLPWEKLTHVPA